MDRLSPKLNQHLDQWPPLSPPVDERNPLVMTAEESRKRLAAAVGYADQGDLPAALDGLSGVRCHPDVGDRWDLLWCEVSAMWYHDQEVFPLAARLSAAALGINPRSGAALFRKELAEQGNWAWRFEGSSPTLALPQMSGGSSKTQGDHFLLVQGYSNADAFSENDQVVEPHQHFHFAVFLASERAYLFSYAVQSQQLAGRRVYSLKQQIAGVPEILRVLDKAPLYQGALEQVVLHLRETIEQGGSR